MTYKAWVGAEFPPRRWQSEAFTPARRSIVAGEWGVVHACTGSGKSRLIAELVAWALASGARVMVTTPSQDLVRQLWKTIADRVGARQVGQVYTARQEPFRPVAVVCHDSMATYAAALAQVGAKADLWIADEAHKTERPSVKEAIEVLTPRRRVGGDGYPVPVLTRRVVVAVPRARLLLHRGGCAPGQGAGASGGALLARRGDHRR